MLISHHHLMFLFHADYMKKVLDEVDLIICIGGDGTLLYTSSLFQVSSELVVRFSNPFNVECYDIMSYVDCSRGGVE